MRHVLTAPQAGLLAALALVSAAEARDLSGAFAYRERIALPPEAVLVVEASDGTGRIVAAERQPAEGAQVPLAFALDVPAGQEVLLRGGIALGAGIHWLSDPVAVPAGEAAAGLGTIPLVPHRAVGLAARLRCGDVALGAGFAGDAAALRIGPRLIALRAETSASGARYVDPADPQTWAWSKGDALSVSLGGSVLPDCVPALPADGTWRASGHEPDWAITVRAGQVIVTTPGAPPAETALPAAETRETGAFYPLDPIGLGLVVTPGLCRDSMTGMPHPDLVTLTEGTAARTGCGGDPATLVAGLDWRVAEVAGAALPEGAEANLRLTSGGGLSGKAACNRFSGRFTLSGEGLRLDPGAMTMMACPDPLMAAERAMLDALARVDRFDFDAGGDLLLLGGDAVLLRARF